MSRASEIVSTDKAKELLRLIVRASQPYQRLLQTKNESDRSELKQRCREFVDLITELNEISGLETALRRAEIEPYHLTIFNAIYSYFDQPQKQKLVAFSHVIQLMSHQAMNLPRSPAVSSPLMQRLLPVFLSISALFLSLVLIALVLHFVLPVLGVAPISFTIFGASVPLIKAVLIGASVVCSAALGVSTVLFCFVKRASEQRINSEEEPLNRAPRKLRRSGHAVTSSFVLRLEQPVVAPPINPVRGMASSPPRVGSAIKQLPGTPDLYKPSPHSSDALIPRGVVVQPAIARGSPPRPIFSPRGAFSPPPVGSSPVVAALANLWDRRHDRETVSLAGSASEAAGEGLSARRPAHPHLSLSPH